MAGRLDIIEATRHNVYMTTNTLTHESAEVADFVTAYQENLNLQHHRSEHAGYRVDAITRRKFILVDEIPTFDGVDQEGRGGRFMIDRLTRAVYVIRAYGQRGSRIGTVAGLTAEYRAGSATFKPEAGAYVMGRGTRAARWAPTEPQPWPPMPEPAPVPDEHPFGPCPQDRPCAHGEPIPEPAGDRYRGYAADRMTKAAVASRTDVEIAEALEHLAAGGTVAAVDAVLMSAARRLRRPAQGAPVPVESVTITRL